MDHPGELTDVHAAQRGDDLKVEFGVAFDSHHARLIGYVVRPNDGEF